MYVSIDCFASHFFFSYPASTVSEVVAEFTSSSPKSGLERVSTARTFPVQDLSVLCRDLFEEC